MTIVKYKKRNPVLRSLLDDVWGTSMYDNTLFDDKKWVPSVNVKESDDNYILEFMVPGFDKKDFKVHAENGILTIEAEITNEEESTDEKYTRREFSFNSFSRSFTLPENVELENIEAIYDKGMLKLSLVKVKMPDEKRLEIKIK